MSFYKHSHDTFTDNTYQSIPSHVVYNNERPQYKKNRQRPGSFHENNYKPSNFRPGSSNRKRGGLAKLNDFRHRVSEAIEMCKRESTEVRGQFSQVVGEEKLIYNLLIDNPSVLNRAASFPDMPHSQQGTGEPYLYVQRPQKPEQPSTPYQSNTVQHISQLSQFIPQHSQAGNRSPIYSPPNGGQQIPSRKQSVTMYQQDNISQQNQPTITFGSNHPSAEILKQSLKKIKSAKEFNLSDNAIQMIEQIQRKAFEQIQKLRKQKLQLMQKLNQQIQNVNQEKKRNAQLSKILSSFTNQAQRPDGSYASSENTQLLQIKIQQLSSELQRANELNNNLRLQFNQRGSGVPGVEQLLRQGEAIRQQTLRLIKLKEQDGSNERIQELERRLAAQQSQKEAVLDELRMLKMKPESNSRNRPFQQVQSYQRSVKVSTPFDKGTTQYEDLVSEMKRITGF